MELSFKRYLEALQAKPNLISAMQDQLGVDPDAVAKTPAWAGNVAVGHIKYNGVMYKINRLIHKGGQVTGAMIQPINVQGVGSQRAYMKKPEGMLRRPDSSVSSGETFMPINLLNQIMGQGLQPGGAAPPGGL